MTNLHNCADVAQIYESKREKGLIDVKFFLNDSYSATTEAACKEVLRMEDAIENGEFEALVFNDRHS